MRNFRRKPLLLAVAASLALSASGFAATSGVNGVRSPGRASVTPPSWSNAHCGKRGGAPPCNTKH